MRLSMKMRIRLSKIKRRIKYIKRFPKRVRCWFIKHDFHLTSFSGQMFCNRCWLSVPHVTYIKKYKRNNNR